MNFTSQTIQLPDFKSSNGIHLSAPVAAYTIYGDLNIDKPVALIFHGFSSCSKLHTWWEKFNLEEMQQFYNVICINSVSSSHGTTGPESINPDTQKPYLETFPEISIEDSVDFAIHTLKHLETNKIDLVLGCSLGGMQVLDMYLRYPELARKFISVAGVPVPLMTKMTNMAQACLIESAYKTNSREELEKMLGFSRFFFRLSCSNETALKFLEKKCQKGELASSLEEYFINDNLNFQKEFSPYSNSIILKMISNFELKLKKANKKICPSLVMISIEDDLFTPVVDIKETYNELVNLEHRVIHKHFMTDYGHEAWIVDGKRFYEFIKSDLYS